MGTSLSSLTNFSWVDIALINMLIVMSVLAISRVVMTRWLFLVSIVIGNMIVDKTYFKAPMNKYKFFVECGLVGLIACGIGPSDNMLAVGLCGLEAYFIIAYAFENKRRVRVQNTQRRDRAMDGIAQIIQGVPHTDLISVVIPRTVSSIRAARVEVVPTQQCSGSQRSKAKRQTAFRAAYR